MKPCFILHRPTNERVVLQFCELYLSLMLPSHCPEVDSRWTTKYEFLKFLFIASRECHASISVCNQIYSDANHPYTYI